MAAGASSVRFVEAFEARDIDTMMAMAQPDVVLTVSSGLDPITGRGGGRQFDVDVTGSDLRSERLRYVEHGDTEFFESRLVGTRFDGRGVSRVNAVRERWSDGQLIRASEVLRSAPHRCGRSTGSSNGAKGWEQR